MKDDQVEQLKTVYAGLEPGGCDAWNPLRSELELWHRTRLLTEAVRALRLLNRNPKELRVLDVGCGVGRSSRLLVELGILPANMLAMDFRADALATARALNPGIEYLQINSLADWPKQKFDLCVQCTAFSSIPGAVRMETARLMASSVDRGGHVFWWDLLRANDFAGGDPLHPQTLFAGRKIVYWNEVSLRPNFAEAAWSLPRGGRLVSKSLKWVPARKTHLCALFGPVT